MVDEQILGVGDLVRVELDRASAYRADEVIAAISGVDALTALPFEPGLDEDFSLDSGALILEFIVSTASGISSGVLTALITNLFSKNEAAPTAPTSEVESALTVIILPRTDYSSAALRIGLLTEEPESNGNDSDGNDSFEQPASLDR